MIQKTTKIVKLQKNIINQIKFISFKRKDKKNIFLFMIN